MAPTANLKTAPVTRLPKNKRERENTSYQSQRWKRFITTDPTDMKTRIKEYYEQCYVYKFDNLDETD